MTKAPKIFDELARIAPLVPTPIYWLDTNHVIVGGNDLCLSAIGSDAKTIREVLIGKTYYDYYPKDVADKLTKIIERVMKTKMPIKVEEKIVDISTGKFRYYETARAPLLDENNIIVGTICTAIEVTDKKESEELRSENEKQQASLELQKIIALEQTQFRQFIGKMVHDIRSPLSSLQNLVQSTIHIPEKKRLTLRSAATTISDIAVHMLNKYSNLDNAVTETRQPVLLSAALEQILSEKRYEYKKKNIRFGSNFRPGTEFICIKIEPSRFKRMMSNLINNAVDAVSHKTTGVVEISLYAPSSNSTIVSVNDNGKGMSEGTIDKITQGQKITIGKKAGYGIGMQQVKETVDENLGKLRIQSTKGQGTSVDLVFPQMKPPLWLATEIKVAEDSVVIVLDDDPSIHSSWDMRFETILEAVPTIRMVHFTEAIQVINFISNLSLEEKEKICLLSDYELLSQGTTGIDVIKQSQVNRTFLVTSHYTTATVQKSATEAQIKILPKELAYAAPIKFDNKLIPYSKKVDAVWVDDALVDIKSSVYKEYRNLEIAFYDDVSVFLEELIQYPTNTKIVLDYYFYWDYDTASLTVNGLTVAEKLYKLGYTNLYLCTNELIPSSKLPPYLKLVNKDQINTADTESKSQINLAPLGLSKPVGRRNPN